MKTGIDTIWEDRKRILGMPISFTKYYLSEDRLFVQTGLLSMKIEETLLYRVTDISARVGLFQRIFGVGTIVNIIGCGVCIDAMLALDWVPQLHSLPGGIAMLLAGLELLALGTWMYMRSALGAGPRDALMVALARKTGRSAGVCRICADILVTVSGFLLGGQFGIGTVISALGLGSLINLNFSLLHFRPAKVHQENIAETLRYLRS